MSLPRIYCLENLHHSHACQLGADNLHYLKTVLRLKPKDPILVFDGYGHEYEAAIESFLPGYVNVTLGKMRARPEKEIHITLAQAIPKAAKMDLIVKTAAELGADEIIPFSALRSVARIESDKSFIKVNRWRKIVQEAARCTRSANIADISPVLSFSDMLLRAAPQSLKMIFWEEEDEQSIRDLLTDQSGPAFKEYFIIVGPEGGLSRDEVAKARAAGFVSVSLGKQILKVETAAAAILSIIQYEKGIFSGRSGERKS